MTGIIRPSGFDSDIFGARIGLATVDSARDADELGRALAGFDGVFVKVRQPRLVALVCNLATVGAVEYRYDFVKVAGGRGVPLPSFLRPLEDPSRIQSLVTAAFETNRFGKDARTAPQAGQLYERWVDRATSEGRVYWVDEGGTAVAFIVRDRDPDGAGRHVLAAVDAASQGKGIYTRMIAASEEAFPIGTSTKGRVAVDTVGPVKVLLRRGYNVAELEAMVHLWR